MLVVGGENLIDCVQMEQSDGEYPLFRAIPGGSPYNMAIAAGRQQIPTTYLTPISTDAHGDALFSRLQDSDVSLSTPRINAPSSLAMVSLRNGIPSYQFYREHTAERMISDRMLKAALTEQDRVFHIGSLALAGGRDTNIWIDFAHHCKQSGMAVSLDPNVRAALIPDPNAYRKKIKQMFGLADIIKCSDEDLSFIFETDELPVMMRELTGCAGQNKIITITHGENGAYIYHDDAGEPETSFIHHPAAQAQPFVDTVGAGDTYMASMLAMVIKENWLDNISDLSLADKMKMAEYASRAAALNCSRQGCNPPTSDEILF